VTTYPSSPQSSNNDDTTTTTCSQQKRSISRLKALVLIICGVFLAGPTLLLVYTLLYQGYRTIDPTRFPSPPAQLMATIKNAGETTDSKAKGAALMAATYAELQRELDSPFGWSINDLFFSPTRWLDNRNARQRGVLFATRMLTQFFSTHYAKLGASDAENKLLKECREKRLVYGEDVWGFFRPSVESEYRIAIKLMKSYETDLLAGRAIFNMRTDDIYNTLVFLLSEEILGQTLGLLVQPNSEVPYHDLDERIYYAQGVVLVVRDFLFALIQLFPETTQKGGKTNIEMAFTELNNICTFDPIIVLRGDHDSLLADHRGKLATYLVPAMKRINDLTQSIRR